MSEIRAFLFDMDGVIVHSNPLHLLAWAEYTRLHGVTLTSAMQELMYGKRNDEIIRDFLGHDLTNEEVFEHGAAKERLYRSMIASQVEAALVPGLRAFLNRHPAVKRAIATNAETANVTLILEESGLGAFFPVAVDGSQVKNAKPHPEIYLKAADLLGVPPEACVVFEDSRSGVEAGLGAGMPVVGLSTTHDDLAGVSLLIADFNDPALEAWLTGLA